MSNRESSVANEAQRVSDVMMKIVNELDRQHLRKIQAEMHYCAAKCCENNDFSIEKVQSCVENCSITLNHAQSFVENQFKNLQSRLNRCMMMCNDDIRDKMGPNPSETEVSRYQREFDGCAKQCIDQQINTHLPALKIRIQSALSSKSFPTNE